MNNLSLIKYEFQKHFNRFNIFFTIIILIIFVGITIYQLGDLFTTNAKIIHEEKMKLLDIYETDPDEYNRLHNSYLKNYSEYEAQYFKYTLDGQKSLANYENVLINLPEYGDKQLFSDVENIVNSQQNYEKAITKLLHESSVRLLETENTDSYNYDYYVKLLNKYNMISDITWETTPIFGWNEFFSIDTTPVFLLILSAGLFYGIFTFEKNHRISNIIRLAKRGTLTLSSAKLMYIVLTAIGFSIIFTLIPFLVLSLSCGFHGGNLPIQALDGFILCPYKITIIQYLMIYLAIRTLFIIGISLVFATLNRIAESEFFSLATVVLIFAVSFISNNISVNSEFYFLKKVNLINLSNVNCLFDSYGTVNIFNNCVNYTNIILMFQVCVCIICIAVILCKSDAKIAEEKTSDNTHFFRPIYSIAINECFKQMFNNKVIYTILCVIILKLIISGVYYSYGNGAYEALYRRYITAVEGPITDEKIAMINAESEYISSNIIIYSKMNTAYNRGDISANEYNEYLGKYNYSNYCKSAHEKLCEKRDYLLKVAQNHNNIEFIYDKGLDKLFKATIDLPAILFLLLVSSVVFSHEYTSKFSEILRLTKHGRKNIFICKYILVIVLSAIIFVIFTAIDLLLIKKFTGIPNLSANIMSMPRFAELNTELSIIEYLIIYKAVGFFGFINFAIFVTSVSIILENMIKTILISGIIVFLPYITDYFGIGLLNIVNINRFILPEKVFNGFITYIIFILVTIFVMLASNYRWIGKKYR